jgi:F-type H+-transporting ATPase subunit delta
MSEQGIARRYAQALFALAEEKQILDEVEKTYQQVIDTIESNADLNQVMYHQIIPAGSKKEIFRKIFGNTVAPLVMNFFMLLIDKRRERYLRQIYQEFMLYVNKARNVMEAEVRSTVALAPNEALKLQQQLEAATGKSVQLSLKVDPTLIGGVIVRIGDRVIDGSVATRLQQLGETLKQATLGK